MSWFKSLYDASRPNSGDIRFQGDYSGAYDPTTQQLLDANGTPGGFGPFGPDYTNQFHFDSYQPGARPAAPTPGSVWTSQPTAQPAQPDPNSVNAAAQIWPDQFPGVAQNTPPDGGNPRPPRLDTAPTYWPQFSYTPPAQPGQQQQNGWWNSWGAMGSAPQSTPQAPQGFVQTMYGSGGPGA